MGNGKKGWWEKQAEVKTENGIERKAPNHKKAALKREADKANNTPMKKEESAPTQHNRKPPCYWTHETIISELRKIETELKHFPTDTELRAMKQAGLEIQLAKHGGINKFRKILGYEPLKKHGYWTDEIIINELKKIETELKHFPTYKELKNRQDLLGAIKSHGGIVKFRGLFGYGSLQKPDGYWTDEIIINELKRITATDGNLPIRDRLLRNRGLVGAIAQHGGIKRFRELMGGKTLRRDGRWTDETIIKELNIIKEETGKFPTQEELKAGERGWFVQVITKHGGSLKFREMLNNKLPRKAKNYWSSQTTLIELKRVVDALDGHIPTQNELIAMKKSSLATAIIKNGGFNKFIKLMGGELRKNTSGYWTYEQTLSDIRAVKEKINRFPTQAELKSVGSRGLIRATLLHGGLNQFREAMGDKVSLYEKYLAESAAYSSKRGKNTEKLMNGILNEWCKANNYPEPIHNKKLAKSNIIEFVCGGRKTIGIDVTNTKTAAGDIIRRKYRKKEYHKYLDELWIVVFSNVFEERDYRKFNNESPDNVRVMSIDVFLKELDISTEEHIISKINAYKNCTFRTKDEFVKHHLNKDLNSYIGG